MKFVPNFAAARRGRLDRRRSALLAGLSAFLPWELGHKADPFASAPAGIQPEWYFVWMFQFLKYLPAEIAASGRVAGHRLLRALAAVLVLVPVLDRGASLGARRPGRSPGVRRARRSPRADRPRTAAAARAGHAMKAGWRRRPPLRALALSAALPTPPSPTPPSKPSSRSAASTATSRSTTPSEPAREALRRTTSTRARASPAPPATAPTRAPKTRTSPTIRGRGSAAVVAVGHPGPVHVVPFRRHRHEDFDPSERVDQFAGTARAATARRSCAATKASRRASAAMAPRHSARQGRPVAGLPDARRPDLQPLPRRRDAHGRAQAALRRLREVREERAPWKRS